jgi:hypothetical protein
MYRLWNFAAFAATLIALTSSCANASEMAISNSIVEQEQSSLVFDEDTERPESRTLILSHDPLDKVQAIPRVLAHGLTLYHDAIGGKKIQSTGFIGSLQTEDFAGRPFTYLNFALPFQVADLWSMSPTFLKSLETAKVTTTITGASMGRSLAYAMADDVRLLEEIISTANAMGGKQNVKRIVSLQGYFDLYLEGHDGRFWIVSMSPKVATPEQVNTWRSQERQMRLKLKTESTYYANLASEWGRLLNPNHSINAKSGMVSSLMADFTLPDGSLNLAKAVQMTANRGVHLESVPAAQSKSRAKTITSSQPDYCWPFLWWSICDWSTYGSLTNNHVAGGGYGQRASNFGFDSWNVSGGNLLSCGTSAFVSMAWWWSHYKGIQFYNMPQKINEEPLYYRTAFNGNGGDYLLYSQWAPDSVAVRMVQRDASGRPEIANFTLPYVVNGNATATNPWDLHGGGQRFLDFQRANYNLQEVNKVGGTLVMNSKWISSLIGIVPIVGAVSAVDYSYSIGSIINEHVGVRDNVMLALYPTGADVLGGPHYSPILKYRIIWGAIQQAWITPVDDPAIFTSSSFTIFPTTPFNSNRQYNMATVEGLAKGVFYFEVVNAARTPREPRDN